MKEQHKDDPLRPPQLLLGAFQKTILLFYASATLASLPGTPELLHGGGFNVHIVSRS